MLPLNGPHRAHSGSGRCGRRRAPKRRPRATLGWASCPSRWSTPCRTPRTSAARSPTTRPRAYSARCASAPAVRALVPGDDARLLALALNRVAAMASRLGRRCVAPALVGFGHVYADLLAGRSGAGAFTVASPSGAAPLMRRLDRPPSSSSRRGSCPATRRARWRRHDARRLRDSSLWNWTYDKVVFLLARAMCAIYSRIHHVFGDSKLGLDSLAMTRESGRRDQSQRLSGAVTVNSGLIQSDLSDSESGPMCRVGPESRHAAADEFSVMLWSKPRAGKMLMQCLSLSRSASWKDGFKDEFLEDSSCVSTIRSGMLVPIQQPAGKSGIEVDSEMNYRNL